MTTKNNTGDNKTANNKPLKVKKVIPTLRQRKTARLMVKALENGTEYKTGAELMKVAGYGTGLQLQPARVLESVGTLKALEELGFTEQNAKNVVVSILNNTKSKDADRLKASEMVFKVHGTFAPDKHTTLNLTASIDDKAVLELAERLRNTLKS